ncbi:MAG: ribonuclease P protein component [Burkholderiaceae bacterium]|nr:ribonuclease P protein component [Burkholderiaceae bacterium]
MTDASFPPEARLHRPSEFAAALKGKRLARGALFIVSAAAMAPVVEGATPGARLGLIIAKRFAARSVTRNAIKRVVREAFRHTRNTLPPADYVVRLNAKVPALSLTALKQGVRNEVDAHFARVARR